MTFCPACGTQAPGHKMDCRDYERVLAAQAVLRANNEPAVNDARYMVTVLQGHVDNLEGLADFARTSASQIARAYGIDDPYPKADRYSLDED